MVPVLHVGLCRPVTYRVWTSPRDRKRAVVARLRSRAKRSHCTKRKEIPSSVATLQSEDGGVSTRGIKHRQPRSLKMKNNSLCTKNSARLVLHGRPEFRGDVLRPRLPTLPVHEGLNEELEDLTIVLGSREIRGQSQRKTSTCFNAATMSVLSSSTDNAPGQNSIVTHSKYIFMIWSGRFLISPK